jgi:hypothetical protein
MPRKQRDNFRVAAWHDPTQGKYGTVRTAQGLVGVPEIHAMESAVILQEIIGLQRPNYTLRNALRSITMNALTAKLPIYTKLEAQAKVKDMVEADLVRGDWDTVAFDLWKNVGHIAVSDEAGMRSPIDVIGIQTRDVAGALENTLNTQIATELETATSGAGTDWGSNSNNPVADILARMTTLGTAGFHADTVLAHPLVWADYFGNDYVKGSLGGIQYPDLQGARFIIPNLQGGRVTGISDYAITSTIAIVMDSSAAGVLGVGPTQAAQYRNEIGGYDGYIVRQWVEPLLVQDDAIRVISAVHA